MLPNRIEEKIERIPEGGCWVWMGAMAGDYGDTWWHGGHMKVHKLVYQLLIGKYPEGLVLDHLCKNKLCCNPYHLEPVTTGENNRRGTCWHHVVKKHAEATHCQKGHAWTPENTYVEPNGKRRCIECKRARLRRWKRSRNDSA